MNCRPPSTGQRARAIAGSCAGRGRGVAGCRSATVAIRYGNVGTGIREKGVSLLMYIFKYPAQERAGQPSLPVSPSLRAHNGSPYLRVQWSGSRDGQQPSSRQARRQSIHESPIYSLSRQGGPNINGCMEPGTQVAGSKRLARNRVKMANNGKAARCWQAMQATGDMLAWQIGSRPSARPSSPQPRLDEWAATVQVSSSALTVGASPPPPPPREPSFSLAFLCPLLD